MPGLARPELPSSLEDAINAFGTPVKIAILRHLALHGAATRGQIAQALDVAAPTIGHNLLWLAEDSVILADPPAGTQRSGKRVEYSLNRREVHRRYMALGEAIGETTS